MHKEAVRPRRIEASWRGVFKTLLFQIIDNGLGLTQILLRVVIELLLTDQTAEVIGLPLVLCASDAGAGLYIHAADRILHRYFGFRHRLSFFLSRVPPRIGAEPQVSIFICMQASRPLPGVRGFEKSLFL
jgi:hypothetical protein